MVMQPDDKDAALLPRRDFRTMNLVQTAVASGWCGDCCMP